MKRSEQKARTKYNIRQAFIDLLQRKEMDNITITELAKSANIDRKTFYLHYDTTFDVYHDIIDDVSNQLDDILKQQNDFDFFIFFAHFSTSRYSFYRKTKKLARASFNLLVNFVNPAFWSFNVTELDTDKLVVQFTSNRSYFCFTVEDMEVITVLNTTDW